MHTPFLSNRLGRWLAVPLLTLLGATTAHAQLAGPKAIPGDYATVTAAITALNAQGVGASGVTFNIAAGYTETFASPTAGAITATGTAAGPIVFQKAGTGANPKLTAGVGTGTQDAILALIGSDYVTLDGLELAENAANTTGATQAEFGVALFRASTTNGAQNNVVRNCVITLNKTNTNSVGIWGANTTAAATTAVAATSPDGANSTNQVNGNTISNSYIGIYFFGSSATGFADLSNEIGSTAGNTLTDIGFGAAAATTTVHGLRAEYQNGLKVENNAITIPGNYAGSGTLQAISLGSASTANSMTGTLLVSGNTISITSASTGTTYGIRQAGTTGVTTVTITNNTVQNCVLTGAANTVTYILNDASTGTTSTMTGNQVLNNSAATTGGVSGIYHTGSSGTVTLSNNTVSGLRGTGASQTQYALRVSSGAYTVTGNTLTDNAILNTSGTSSSTMWGYYSLSSASSENLSNNTITNLRIAGASTSASSTLGGMRTFPTSTTTKNIFQNTIGGLALGATGTAGGTVYGIYSSSGNAVSVYRNKVYDLSAGNAGALVEGINVTSSTTLTLHNNLVGDLRAPTATGLTAINGLNLGSNTAANVYFNTVYLAATSSGATFGTSGLYMSSNSTSVDARNNVVVNKSTAMGTTGLTAALRLASGTAGTAPAALAAATNNNLYFAGTPSATSVIYVEGTTTTTNAQQTLAAYKAFVASRESNSVTEDVPFLSTTGTAATFLHISPGTPTQVESGGTPVAGITIDFDGETRNANFPDIGADEGTFQPLDQTGPSISYTALGSTGSTTNRTLTVTISDPSGISTTTPPRLFFRKGNTGAFVSVLATSVSGSTYTFTLDYALVGGVMSGDAIQYYVVAQDVPGNVNSSPAGNTFTTPASVNVFTILNALSGTYYVGTSPAPAGTPAGRIFPTLTAAANAYGNSGMSGATTFLLLDNTYSATTGETFPIIFFNNPDASATNTLLVQPAAGVTATVTGVAAPGLIILAGTRYVTLDGANTTGGTTRNLTVTNTAITASTYVIGLVGQTGLAQANLFATVRNVNVVGGGTTANSTLGLVVSGADNDNVTLQNNSVQGVTTGIQAFGSATVSAGGLDNLVITGNVVGGATANAATNINQTGIVVVNALAPVLSLNEVQNVTNPTATSGSGLTGILFQDVRDAQVSRNTLHDLFYTGTSTAKLYGISQQGTAFTTATAASANRFDNNLVYRLNSTATSSAWNTSGINNNGGFGDQYYYNTVYLTGQLSVGTAGSAAFSNGNGNVAAAAPNVDVRNNIFSIVGGTGAATTPLYAHYTTLTSYAGSTLNNNDLFVSVGATGVSRIGRINGADATTLADWRTATGQEAASVSVDPQPTQTTTVPYDLTPTNAALNNAGTPIAGVTVDYNGTTRGTTPDIGAYEFSLLDLTVTALTGPTAGNGCYSATEAVSVTIRNAANMAVDFATTPATVTVTVTGGAAPQTITTTVNTGTLAPGATLVVAVGTVNLAPAGTYSLTAAVAVTGDENAANNTLATPLTIVSTPRTVAFTYPAGTICAGSGTTVAATLGAGSVTGGTFSAPAGLTINATTGVITPATSTAGTYVVTYAAAASGSCPALTATQSVTIAPGTTATFSYGGGTFCVSGTNPTATVTGTAGGTFSAPTGLTINATTGTITLSSSTPGTYTVTYTVAGACGSSGTRTVTISTAPMATFTYGTASTFCVSGTTNPTPSFGAGASGGVFTSTTGLTINATTGVITLATSTPGTYTVTNSIAANGGCAAATATTSVTINAAPVATFSYATATGCAGSTGTAAPTLGTGATTGTFSSTTGLTINATTGVITLATSAAGTYTVTNTVAAAGGCAAATATTTFTVNPATTATFAYAGTTFCATGTNPTPTVTGTAGGTFSATTGLSLNATTGAINLSASTIGTYTVTYTVTGTCGSSATASVTITAGQVATFSYGTASTFCVSGTTAPAVVLGTGASAGTFTAATGLTINATTGAITLSSSTPGTYTVTNTVAAAGGCAATTATTSVTITAAPVATFSYATAAGCQSSSTNVQAVLGAGATAGTFSAPAGLRLNITTGAITPSSSTPGTYTVTNTVAAAGGCAAATATATFTVNPQPATPLLTAAYNGNVTTLTSSAATGNQFFLNGVAIAGATGQTYVINGAPAQLGSYTVVVTNANGCASLPSTVLVVTAARNSMAGSSLRVYPNPTPTGQVVLELTGYRLATQLTVFDALGRVVATELLPAASGTATHALNLTGVAPGVYTLRLSNTDGTVTRRLVRE